MNITLTTIWNNNFRRKGRRNGEVTERRKKEDRKEETMKKKKKKKKKKSSTSFQLLFRGETLATVTSRGSSWCFLGWLNGRHDKNYQLSLSRERNNRNTPGNVSHFSRPLFSEPRPPQALYRNTVKIIGFTAEATRTLATYPT